MRDSASDFMGFSKQPPSRAVERDLAETVSFGIVSIRQPGKA
jgi:hypothetical protein